jgi:hypothetical protein
MTRARWIALVLIFLSGGFPVVWGFLPERAISGGMLDFKGVYYGERCLFQHSDPYKHGEPLRVYQAEGHHLSPTEEGLKQNLTWYIYLPTTFILIAPFAMLQWGTAHLLWMLLISISLILAALLTWDLGANFAPVISVGLICLVLANCEILLATGNAAGIVVGLCAVAVWCFLKERFIFAGILCMSVSLAIKPHDAGLVWLYFLLAGGILRKRALQTLLMTVVLAVPSILWVSQVAPQWAQELHSNLLAVSEPGMNSDPGPANPVYDSGPSMIIDLQSSISAFRNDPLIYNLSSYLICGLLLAVWIVRTLRLRFSQAHAYVALAAVVPLTMLVTYHRSYDAKLLLLTVPACAMLWARGGLIAWLALTVNSAGILLTSDIPLTILMIAAKNTHRSTDVLSGQLITDVLLRPTPLILFAMGIFYLWVYVRREPCEATAVRCEGVDAQPAAVH